jgi:glycerol-1-phosphate dehydrogenase [NAD(P)+]
MDEILAMNVSQMTGISFDCSCGKMHSVNIKHIIIKSDGLFEVVNLASEYKSGKVFIFGDSNTYAICGKRIEEHLLNNGFDAYSYVFQNTPLIPNEKALGRLLVEMSAAASLIIAVGSGTVNDLGRMLSCKTHIPYFIVCTAPSMDGYASTVSPLIIDEFKTTYEAVAPSAIIVDTTIIKNAPIEMIQAGFGDIIGKYTALTDWILSRELSGEYYCETSVKLMEIAINKCVNNLNGIARRDEKALKYIIEALILSGIAMGIVGNSRPASGAEHHMAHYWEMDALARHSKHPLHGNAVGIASIISASLYELMRDKIPAACTPPTAEEIIAMLRSVGACTDPAALGISKDLFHASILNAKDIRSRYTILRFAFDLGVLGEYADVLTNKFYGDS